MESSVRRGPSSIVFDNFFSAETFRSGFFCIESKNSRPFELILIIFRSINQQLWEELRGTYKFENILSSHKRRFAL